MGCYESHSGEDPVHRNFCLAATTTDREEEDTEASLLSPNDLKNHQAVLIVWTLPERTCIDTT